MIFGKRQWNHVQLRKRDPEILALFEKLEADKKAGRF